LFGIELWNLQRIQRNRVEFFLKAKEELPEVLLSQFQRKIEEEDALGHPPRGFIE